MLSLREEDAEAVAEAVGLGVDVGAVAGGMVGVREARIRGVTVALGAMIGSGVAVAR